MGGVEVDSALGKEVEYEFTYNPELLFPIRRQEGRDRIPVQADQLPFEGMDIWTGYEVSWLNSKGKPVVRIAEFTLPATTPNLIESKSFKLYLNSFNQTNFESESKVVDTMVQDLSKAAGGEVQVALFEPTSQVFSCQGPEGYCVDDLDISVDVYQPDASLLTVDSSLMEGSPSTKDSPSRNEVTETLYSHLLRSNCPVTGQPDWGTLVVEYTGRPLNKEAFLKYVVSFRQHTGFHEQCVEQAFVDLKAATQASSLTVYARYLRRGGLDINPYRSMNGSSLTHLPKHRFHRQ